MSLRPLPLARDIESTDVLRAAASAHRYLAELKGVARTIPNPHILTSLLALQEAKDSSAIENIITTHDEMYRGAIHPVAATRAAQEVIRYGDAIRFGYQQVTERKILTTNDLIQINSIIELNDAGFRKTPGTVLKNDASGEVIYTPPQDPATIVRLMSNLLQYINEPDFAPGDPLVKMAVIHHQFESIHPFYDGNGRTGRLLNVLYLVLQGLLDSPIVYLSREIIRTKSVYYQLLRDVNERDSWEQWAIYMLNAVESTARHTSGQVNALAAAIHRYKRHIRDVHSFYSHELIDSLFQHPFTTSNTMQNDLRISRPTTKKYLEALTREGLLAKHKFGRTNYYVNVALYEILVPANDR